MHAHFYMTALRVARSLRQSQETAVCSVRTAASRVRQFKGMPLVAMARVRPNNSFKPNPLRGSA